MTIAVDMGRKATKTNKHTIFVKIIVVILKFQFKRAWAPGKFILLSCFLLLPSDLHCKQIGSRLGQIKYLAQSGLKLMDLGLHCLGLLGGKYCLKF